MFLTPALFCYVQVLAWSGLSQALQIPFGESAKDIQRSFLQLWDTCGGMAERVVERLWGTNPIKQMRCSLIVTGEHCEYDLTPNGADSPGGTVRPCYPKRCLTRLMNLENSYETSCPFFTLRESARPRISNAIFNSTATSYSVVCLGIIKRS